MSAPRVFADPEFVTRLQRSDSRALEDVIDTYLPQVFRAAKGAGLTAEQAEDVAQATFVTFLETIARFEGRSHVRTWIFGILYRKIQELWRGLGREQSVGDVESVSESRFDANGHWVRPPRDIEARLGDAEIRLGISQCLERLRSNQRMAFVLREIQGFSTKEICNILETSATNVGVLLHRARNGLRECLEGKGFDE